MRYYQILLLLLFLMPTAARSDCAFPWPQGTFLQVYDSHLTKDSDGWRHDISRWKSLGVEELVLQWSAYGSPEGEAFPIIESGTLRRLLDAAEAAAVKLRIGLRYDPGFWDHHAHDESSFGGQASQAPSDLVNYLFRRGRDQQALIAALAPLALHPAFGGWYISDEIDDLRWRSLSRRQLLNDYLAKLVDSLKEETPSASIAISAFSNGLLAPLELAEFLEEVTTNNGIDQLFFQDGIGARKLEMSELGYYIPVLSKKFQDSPASFTLIVELFETSPADDGFLPASAERIEEQLLHAATSGGAPFTFSLPHHADPRAGEAAGLLARELKQLKQKCGL